MSLREATFTALAVATIVLPARCTIPCAQCHPKEVAGFAATPMGRSLGSPSRQPGGQFTHSFSHTQFSIESGETGMVQRLERNGLEAEYNIAYAIGSGAHAFMGLTVTLYDYQPPAPRMLHFDGYQRGAVEDREADVSDAAHTMDLLRAKALGHEESTEFIQAIAILVFVANLVISYFNGDEAGNDPWDAWTLEWSISSPPPAYNFATVRTVSSRSHLWDQKHPEDPDSRYE